MIAHLLDSAKPLALRAALASLTMAACMATCEALFAMTGARAEEQFEPPGKLYPVFDTVLHLYCVGEGSPTIVLEAGLGGNYLDWSRVQPLLSAHHRLCAYDRAGAGFSSRTERSRTAANITGELHALVEAAELEKPFILVGHSFGGMMALHYAKRYPEEVKGLVLLDPMHPEQFDRFQKAGVEVPTEPNLILGRTASFAATYALPESLHARAIYLAGTDTARIFMVKEMRWMMLDAAEVKAAGYPHLPALILLHGNREWDGAYPDGRMERAWQDMHRELAKAIDAPPPRLIAESGHQIALDAPESVRIAVEEVAR